MTSQLKANANTSQLVMIDMQVRLASVMPSEAMHAASRNCAILLQSAKLLAVPCIVTEQYPQGLGATLPELAEHLQEILPIAKTSFSCLSEPKFSRQLTRDHSQVILSGMETHICVLQTALDIVATGKQVMVVEDAVISRKAENKANALARMREAGCIITNTESVVFEWLGVAEGDAFKAISKLIR